MYDTMKNVLLQGSVKLGLDIGHGIEMILQDTYFYTTHGLQIKFLKDPFSFYVLYCLCD